MSDVIRGFPPGDVMARGIDPTRFRTRSDNGCWLRPQRSAPAPPPPRDCARVRCDEPAATDNWCARHAVEEAEWRSIDPAAVTRLRHATRLRGRPEGSPSPRHPEGSNDG